MTSSLRTVDGRPTLRFERRLAHPVERVWQAVTDPDELKHWFPARLEGERKPGADIRFTFDDHDIDMTEGRIVEFEPPRLFAYTWGESMLRWELVPDGDGCRLIFTHMLGGDEPWGDIVSAPRHAAGWDGCLRQLHAFLDGPLDGRHDELPDDFWLERSSHYLEAFGLDQPTTADGRLRFVREILRPAEEVWAAMVGNNAPAAGDPAPPAVTAEGVPAGPIIEVEPARALAYAAPDGEVRWELMANPVWTRVTVTVPSTQPAEAWRKALKAFYHHSQ
jgi:uncharacterized protein YndB with AHSA1/START domain